MPRLIALTAAALIGLTGCAVSAVQTAKTNGQGNIQVGLEPGVLGFSGGGASAFVPAGDVSVRYGVSDTVDIGGRIGTAGIEFQSKFQLTGDDGVVISPAPSFIFAAFGGGGAGGGFVAIPIPVLFDIPVGESALVLGPRVRPTIAFAGGGGASAGGFALSGGASVGYAAKLADGFRLMPEFGMEVPLVAGGGGSAGGTSGSAVSAVGGGMIWQVKVGLLLGKTK